MVFFSWCEQKTNPDTPGTVIMFRKSATWKIPRGKCSPFCLVKGFVCWDKRKGKQTESLKCVCVYCARDEGIASTSLLVCFSSLLVPPPLRTLCLSIVGKPDGRKSACVRWSTLPATSHPIQVLPWAENSVVKCLCCFPIEGSL